MPFTFAGRYGPEPCLTPTGALLKDTAVTVYQSDGTTPATLYTTRTKSATAANPVDTDSRGNLTFYADPGDYVLDIDGSTVSITVPVDTIEVAQDSDLAAYTPTANDAVFVSHGATAGTARPAGAGLVIWYGSVEPTNSAAHDIWLDSSS